MPGLLEDQIIDLYDTAPIPTPAVNLLRQIASTSDEAQTLKLIHAYFDAIATTYPRAARQFIEGMFYDQHHIVHDPALIERGNAYAAVEVKSFLETANPNDLKLSVLPAVCGNDIRYCITLIHEVAGHVGQLLSRLEQVGIDRLRREHDSYSLDRLMERTSGLLEQPLIKAVHSSLLFAPSTTLDAEQMAHDESYRALLARDRGSSLNKYMQLQDHCNIPPSNFEYNLFLMRMGGAMFEVSNIHNQCDVLSGQIAQPVRNRAT